MKLWDWFPEDDKRVTFYSIQSQREQQPDWFKEDLAALFELALEGNIDPQIWKRMPLQRGRRRPPPDRGRCAEVRGKIVLEVSADTGRRQLIQIGVGAHTGGYRAVHDRRHRHQDFDFAGQQLAVVGGALGHALEQARLEQREAIRQLVHRRD